ncbi:MAG: antitoxin VbhA family protein [Methylobacillus sp.]|jgi:hypothetical protein|nr:antitoxin VbhA family protein [Methylobacillus sp.]
MQTKRVADAGYRKREKIARHVVGTLAIEGQKMTDAGLDDLARYVQGELTAQDMVQKAIRRHRRN